jgi:hypothetical protein
LLGSCLRILPLILSGSDERTPFCAEAWYMMAFEAQISIFPVLLPPYESEEGLGLGFKKARVFC